MENYSEITLSGLERAQAEGGEMALIDVRPVARFAAGHVPGSVSVPLERLEPKIVSLAPRRAVPLVLIGDMGEHERHQAARRAASSLCAIGYSRISVLTGGFAGYESSGRAPFRGMGGLAMALARWSVRVCGTPVADNSEIMRLTGENLVVDCREPEDFFRESIPGSFNAPGLEAANRLLAQKPAPSARIIVVGGTSLAALLAQTLISAGLPNPISVLDKGVDGWRKGGLGLAKGSRKVVSQFFSGMEDPFSEPAEKLAKRFKIGVVAWPDLAPLTEDVTITLRLIDVRSREEFKAGHPAGFVNIPSGQFLSNLERSVPVAGSVIVLNGGDEGVLAHAAAAWVVQSGRGRAFVLHDKSAPKETGDADDYSETTFLNYLKSRIHVFKGEEEAAKLGHEEVIVDVTPGPGPPGEPAALRTDRTNLLTVLDELEIRNPRLNVLLASQNPLDAYLCAAEMLRANRAFLVYGKALSHPPDSEPGPEPSAPSADELMPLVPPNPGDGPPDRPPPVEGPGEAAFKRFP